LKPKKATKHKKKKRAPVLSHFDEAGEWPISKKKKKKNRWKEDRPEHVMSGIPILP
jgi:hypothetical protein